MRKRFQLSPAVTSGEWNNVWPEIDLRLLYVFGSEFLPYILGEMGC